MINKNTSFFNANRDTAISAIKKEFPNSKIESEQLDEYPIIVKIFAGEERELIFESPQRELFRKYPDLRKKSIKKIRKAVRKYVEEKEGFNLGNFMMR